MGFKDLFDKVASSPVGRTDPYCFDVGDFFYISLKSIDDRPCYFLDGLGFWIDKRAIDRLERIRGNGSYKSGDVFKVKIVRIVYGETYCYVTDILSPCAKAMSDREFSEFCLRGEHL